MYWVVQLLMVMVRQLRLGSDEGFDVVLLKSS
jgi:hypothetical protein